MNTDSKQYLIENFVKLLDIYLEFQKNPKDYGSGDKLTQSEIHLIKIIADDDKNNSVTELAKITNVTKGAISQTLNKLEKKKLINKVKDENNNSKLNICLTNKGYLAYYGHEHYHDEQDMELLNFFDNLDNKEEALLSDTFCQFEKWLLKCLNTGR